MKTNSQQQQKGERTMRFKGYMQQRIGDDRPEFRPFGEDHFRTVGMKPMTGGMPVLEAYQIVNEMNKQSQRTIHWLEPAAA